MQRKILVFGANGQLGQEILRRAAGRATGFDRGSVDICDEAAVAEAVRAHPPRSIVNVAAFTAVDRADTEVEAAFRVNRDGSAALAKAASLADVPFVAVSSDYVFDGAKRTPYHEDDPVAPLNVYGRSKAEGERAIRRLSERHIILRTSWVYSPHGTNFVRTMLRLGEEQAELKIVDDQIGCPTAAADLASAILTILSKVEERGFADWGTYHYRGADIVSWYGFAGLIFEEAAHYGGPTPRLVPIETTAFRAKAIRPAYSVLCTEKIAKTFGIKPRPLRDSLRECLAELKQRGA